MRRALLLLLLALPAAADVVVLQRGGKLSCEIVAETDESVTVRLPHGTMVIPRSRIASILREDTGDYLRREGDRSLRAGETKTAVELFEKAHADAATDVNRRRLVQALEARAKSLVAEHRHDEAKAAVRRLEELSPGHAVARRLAAKILVEERLAKKLYERAHRALDIGAFTDALVLLDAWRVRRPVDDPLVKEEMAAAHLGAAGKATESGNLRQALDHFRAAAAYGATREADEALYLLRPLAVLEALKEGDDARAGRLLDGIETTYPQPAVPAFLQAVQHHLRGEVGEAVAGYAEAARLAEKGSTTRRGLGYDIVRQYARATLRAAIANPPQEGVTRWREIFLAPLKRNDSARHVVVYAATDKVAAEVAALADDIYVKIATELLGRVPAAGKAEVVVHPSREAYVAADPSPPGTPLASVTIARSQTAGVCYETLDEKGKSLTRLEMYVTERYKENTLPHEIVHLVQRRGLAVFRKAHWLDEGLAMLFESERGRANRLALWRQLRKNAIPLPELLLLKSTPPDKVTMFYVEGYALTDFLRARGDAEDWRRFLGAFGEGSFENALRVYDIESVAELERLWLASN